MLGLPLKAFDFQANASPPALPQVKWKQTEPHRSLISQQHLLVAQHPWYLTDPSAVACAMNTAKGDGGAATPLLQLPYWCPPTGTTALKSPWCGEPGTAVTAAACSRRKPPLLKPVPTTCARCVRACRGTGERD